MSTATRPALTVAPTSSLRSSQRVRVMLWLQASRFVPRSDLEGDKRGADGQPEHARESVEDINVGVVPVLRPAGVAVQPARNEPQHQNNHHSCGNEILHALHPPSDPCHRAGGLFVATVLVRVRTHHAVHLRTATTVTPSSSNVIPRKTAISAPWSAQ